MNEKIENPGISVIIYVYNHEKYISECIDSILQQTLQPAEIVICDDHSTDKSWQIIKDYENKHADLIKAFRHKKNMGMQYNANFGVCVSNEELFSSLGGDDYWLPEKLQKEWEKLKDNPSAKIAYSNVITVDAQGKKTEVWYHGKGEQPPSGDVFIPVFSKRFFNGNRNIFRNQLMYRFAFDEVGGYDENIPVHVDWDLKIRLTAKYKVVYSGAKTVVYRIHSDGVHNSMRDKLYDSALTIIKKNKHLLAKYQPKDIQAVETELHNLLVHLASTSGKRHEEIQLPSLKVNGGIIVNSLPKAGTNLLTKVLGLFPQLSENKVHFGYSNKELFNQGKNKTKESVFVGVDFPHRVNAGDMKSALASLTANEFASGHIPFSPAAVGLLKQLGIKMVLMLRDPRDVVVSHAKYVATNPDHPLHTLYSKLSVDEQIEISICGSDKSNPSLTDIGSRLKSILGWMEQPFVYTTYFEKLVGKKGGGSDEEQLNELQEIAEFLGIDTDNDQLSQIAANIFGGTGTFRKGKIAGWKKDFNENHKKLFSQNCGQLLIDIGYEENNDWVKEGNQNKFKVKQNRCKSNRVFDGSRLIFLISQPRAGSTLLQRILGSHSQVHTVAEPWIMLHPVYALREQGIQTEYSSVDARVGLKDFTSHLPEGEQNYYDAIRAMSDVLYTKILEKSEKNYFLDKTPRYYFIINELRKIYPDANYIFLLRNPLAVLSSILKTWVKSDWQRLQLHKHDLFSAPRLLMEGINNLGDKSNVVHYENLVTNPEQVVSEICNKINLPFQKSILEYGKFAKPVGSMGDATGVEKYTHAVTDSLNKWITDLGSPESKLLAEVYLSFLGETLFNHMGYSFEKFSRQLQEIEIKNTSLSNEKIASILGPLGLGQNSLNVIEQILFKYSTRSANSDPDNPILASAIVSTYNAEQFIEGCLKSLINQTLYKKNQLEIIVIDSNSPQNERVIIEKFQSRYKHIRYLKTEERETVYQAWNRGIKMAAGKYVTNANTDDRLRADAIETLVNLLENNPDKAVTYGNSLVTNIANETFENNSAKDTLDWPDFDRNTMHSYCYIGPHPVWRKQLHDEFGYFDTSLKAAADWDFWLRIAQKYDFFHLNEYVGLYYLSNDTISQKGDLPILEAHYLRKKYKNIYKNFANNIIIPNNLRITEPGEKNLLICTHNFPPFWYSGTENYVLQLAKSLKSKGWNVHVFFPHVDQNQIAPELRIIRFEGIQTLQLWSDGSDYVHFLDSGGEKHLQIFEILLKNNHYNLVHFQHILGFPLEYFKLLKNKDIPYVFTIHDFSLPCFRSHLFIYEDWKICDGPESQKCANCLFKFLNQQPKSTNLNTVTESMKQRLKHAKEIIKSAQMVTAPSKFVAQKFAQFGLDPESKIQVLPLGINGGKSKIVKGKRKGLVFGFLGTITPLKNVPFMIESFMAVQGKTKLLIWGAGEKGIIESIERYKAQDSRVEYRGSYTPEDIPAILNQVDVVILPSLIESYSFVIRESFKYKTPVIASAVGGILEIIENNVTGLIFDPNEKQSLASCIEKIIAQPKLIDKFIQNIPTVRAFVEDVDYLTNKYQAIIKQTQLNSKEKVRDTQSQIPIIPKVTFLANERHSYACPQIRLAGPIKCLAEDGIIEYNELDFISSRSEEIPIDQLKQVDLLIIQRNFAHQVSYKQLIKALGEHSPKIIFEFDDAFDRIPKIHPGYKYYQQMKPNFLDYITHSDLVTVSTNTLKKYYNDLNENMVVLPNTINEKIWLNENVSKNEHSGKIRILFAGTIGHEPDLQVIEDVLLKILLEFSDSVQLLLWGNELPELQKLNNVEVVTNFKPDYADYAEILKQMQVDFALVPLAINDFNKAKSNIKWLEYSACKIPGIYTNIPAYRNSVKNNKTGIVVANEFHHWYNAIKLLITNPQKRAKMAENAYNEVTAKHTLQKNLHFWKDTYLNLLQSEAVDKIDISIIIPVYNKLEYTQKCVDALLENTEKDTYEIIIVNNASTDETSAYLHKISTRDNRIKIINNEQNLGFAKANNQGAQIAKGQYLLFLNNDTEVQPNWLSPLIDVLNNDKSVAAVGSKLLYPDGTLQHAGVVIVEDRQTGDPLVAKHNYYQQNGNLAEANELRTYQALTAACLLVKKDVFEKVDRFDEGYVNGYEDVDLCFKLQQSGYVLVYQPKSVVIHHESKSGSERWKNVNENIKRLHDKWLGVIKPDIIINPDGQQVMTNAKKICKYELKGKKTDAITLNDSIDRIDEGKNDTITPNDGSDSFEGNTNDTITSSDGIADVSIIMLTYNALEYTKKCIQSIERHTSIPYEIIFVDNGSTDGTKKYLNQLIEKNNNYKLIANKKNLGFAAGNNQGVKKAEGKYILFLNNDVEVSDGWLESMVRTLELDKKIGMVGPITNMISGRQQVENVDYTDQEGFHQFVQKVRQINKGVITPRRRIAGFAMLMRKSLYESIGGFDESLGIGNYEDDDLCIRVREKGYAIMVDESTFIHHYGSRSFVENKIDYLESLEDRGKKFKQKWPKIDYEELIEVKNPLFEQHEKQIVRATELLSKGESEQAINLFYEILADNPISAEALLGSAYCARKLKKNNEAIIYLKRLIELQPDNAIVYNQLGIITGESGDLENAKLFFINAIDKDPKFIDAQRNYAGTLIQMEQFEEGIVALNKILENHPDDEQTLIYLAQLYIEAGKNEEAGKLLAKVLAVNPKNEFAIELAESLQVADKVEDEQSEDLLLKGQKTLEDGKPEESLKIYSKVLEKYPQNTTALYGSGLANQILGKNEQAKKLFSQVINLEPEFVNAYNNLGSILILDGKYDDAINKFEHALKLDSSNLMAQLNLADTFIEAGKYEEGIQTLMLVLKNNPGEINALLRLGNLSLEAGNYEQANRYFDQVLKIDPGNEIAKQALSYRD